MSQELPQPIIFDSTVLSNFASVDAIDWLIESFERPAVVPTVRDELERGREHGYQFLAAAIDPIEDDLPLIEVTEGQPPGSPDYVASLDPGEAESLLAAEEHNGTFASDDHKAREIAKAQGITVTGSVGILGRGVRQNELEIETADAWLDTWINEFGYLSPVDSIRELLETNDS